MAGSRNTMSFRQQVMDELAAAGGPLSISEMTQRLFDEDMPTRAAEQRIRSAVGTDNQGVVRVGKGTYDLVERRLEGARFRYRVSPWELKAGLLYVSKDFEFVFRTLDKTDRTGFAERNLTLSSDGRPLEASTAQTMGPSPPHVKSPLHDQVLFKLIVGLGPFYREHEMTPSDDLIITVQSLRHSRYDLSVQRAGARDDEAIQAADEEIVEICHSMLKYTKEAMPEMLLQRLIGLYDFRQGPAPHLPMLLLPRDPRFIFFDLCYYLREYLSPETPGDYEEGLEREEIEVLLRGTDDIEITADDRAELAREIVREMIPEAMATEERINRITEKFLSQRQEALEADAQRTELMYRLCYDRMRVLRGLWPDEPDPDSPEQWLRKIGAPV